MTLDDEDQIKEVELLELHHEVKKGPKNRCARCCFKCCRPLMTKTNPLPPQPSRCDRLAYACRCPPHAFPGRFLTALVMIVCLYGLLFVLVGDEALPGHCTSTIQNITMNKTVNGSIQEVEIPHKKEACTGNFFGLFILFICAMIGGFAVSGFLPPLLGMMIVGFLLANIPYVSFARTIAKPWSSTLRNIALCIILIRAGMGLDPEGLKRLSGAVFRLAFTPCLVETIVDGIVAHFVLGLPIIWGFMLGFVLAAVSPAVVVPCMLRLEEQRLGTNKGIPTLVIAASSIDDVLAITGFGVMMAVVFSTSNLVITLVRGPLETLLGIMFGLLVGPILWYLPNRKNRHFLLYRFILLFGSCLIALLGSKKADVPGAGALACLSVSFTAALGWKRLDGWIEDKNPLVEMFATAWWIAQPFLFGLIGAEVRLEVLQPQVIGWGILTLVIGLVFRMITCFFVVLGSGMSLKERFFIALAWLPKATVQAAIGSYALDTAVGRDDEVGMKYGLIILTTAVLSILVTAPIGAFFIDLTAPRLLQSQAATSNANRNDVENREIEEDREEET